MPDDDTPLPEKDNPRRASNKKPDREESPEGDRPKRRSRDDTEEEWEEDDRPRRRRRQPEEPEYDPALKMVVPLNTSGLAIAAGYLGLVSVLCLPAPLALLLGILALRHLKKYPKQDGKVRAIFGIVMGAIFSLVMAIALVASLIK